MRGGALLGSITVALLVCQAAQGQAPADREIVLATTTSVRDAGLLEQLLPPFETATGYRIKVIAVGSGHALALGRRGEADIVISHDPDRERAFIEDGFGIARVPLMSNEFVIVGPGRDEAGVRGLSAVEAFRVIAVVRSRFVSRADLSGTHAREARLWSTAGIVPSGRWYLESGQGMSATLQIANELEAYALTDVATLYAHKYPLSLDILVQGDPLLRNPYHVLLPHPERFPWINASGAMRLQAYLESESVQRRIGDFRSGSTEMPLFAPAMSAASQQ